MAKPYDATTRQLIEMDPVAWLESFGIPVPDPSQVRVVDSNLATILPEADRVIRVDGADPWIEQFELQAGRDLHLPDRAHLYSVVLGWRYEIPVRTTLILLRPQADGPELTGLLEKRDRDGAVYAAFRYDVVRVWELPPERFLRAGLPVLPLAPVAKIDPDRLRDVLAAVAGRLRQEATPDQALTLWRATTILLSLRYTKEQVQAIVKEVSNMSMGIRGIEESWLFQEYFQKGLAEGEARGLAEGEARGRAEAFAVSLDHWRKHLLLIGRRLLGEPGEAIEAAIHQIDDPDRLDTLVERALQVSTWEELLDS